MTHLPAPVIPMNMLTSSTSDARRCGGSLTASFGLALLLIFICGGTMQLWQHRDGFEYALLAKPGYGIALAVILAAILWARRISIDLFLDLRGYALGLALLFFSEFFTRNYSFFQAPAIRGEILLLSALSFWLFLRGCPERLRFVAWPALAVVVLSFFTEAGGRLLFSDDHPVFLFRLISLTHAFPFIPFYNPLWNAGLDARDFFATGALNVFALTFPLLYSFDPISVYNYVAALIVFILLPVSIYLSCRISSLPKLATAIAVLLSFTSGLVWYRWGLRYGTMGFITSASLFPLALTLGSQFLAERGITRARAAEFVLVASLMLLWSLSGVACLAAAILALFSIRKLWGNRAFRFSLVALLIINLPWVALFWKVSNVGKFMQAERPSYQMMHQQEEQKELEQHLAERGLDRGKTAKEFDRKQSLKTLRDHAVSTNPLIWLFALPGLWLLPKPLRGLLAVTLGWLVILGAIISPLKPQLELDRMLLMASVLAAIPAGLALQRFFTEAAAQTRLISRVLPALTLGFLLAGAFCTTAMVRNRAIVHYAFADYNVEGLAQAVRAHQGPGRLMFAGFVLHEWSHGHLAPLVYMTELPAVASSYAHDQWKYRSIFPDYVLRDGAAAKEAFFDLYNVTAVAAHEQDDIKYFELRSDIYRPVWEGKKFKLYTRRTTNLSYFLSGSGEILEQSPTRLRVRVDSSEAVLRFNYFPFLQSSQAQLSPENVAPNVRFVRVSGVTPGAEIVISSVGPLTRLML